MIVHADGVPIKIEIIAEVRFELDPPRYPQWSPVACLSLNNCFTSKLLSNSDRYIDDSVESRDLIDLAVLRLQSSIPQKAVDKAEKAYEVIRPLKVAVQRFQERVDYRERCFSGLRIDNSQILRIIDGIALLAGDLGLASTPGFPQKLKHPAKELHKLLIREKDESVREYSTLQAMRTENIVVSLPFDYPHFWREQLEEDARRQVLEPETWRSALGRALTPQGLVMPVIPQYQKFPWLLLQVIEYLHSWKLSLAIAISWRPVN